MSYRSIVGVLLLGDTLQTGSNSLLSFVEGRLIAVDNGHVELGVGGDLSNSGSHQTSSNDGDVVDLRELGGGGESADRGSAG